MERLVLCACVGPQRTLGAPGEGAISGSCARRMKAAGFICARRATFLYFVRFRILRCCAPRQLT